LIFLSIVLALSLRSVKSARKELIELGIITPDTGSNQWKLNKTGAYFTVNLGWVGKGQAPQVINSALSTGLLVVPSFACPVDNLNTKVSEFAPPVPQKCILFAPPYKDKKTPYGSKNQKASGSAQIPTGFCKTKKDPEKPKIYDVKPEDLGNFSRVEELYFQAVRKNLIEPTEAGAINFLAAAVRAKSVLGAPQKVFMGIIRKRLWKNITQADEDRALSALKRFREENPDRFRIRQENKWQKAA